VRNRHLNKRDTAMVIHDIWHRKTKHDATRLDGKREKMSDYLNIYLHETFGLDQMAIEWAYSLRDAAQKFATEPRIGLFWRVLIDEADEELHFERLQQIARLAAALTVADREHIANGLLTCDDFTAILTDVFRIKDNEAVQNLVKAAETDLNVKPDEPLQFENLFIEDNEGQTGPFLEELQRQEEEERMQFVQDIVNALDGKTSVTVDDMKHAIISTDPEVDPDSLSRCLLWLFADPDVAGHLLASRDTESLTFRLQSCSVRRAGPKP
jgi:hypothetical protein